MNEILDDWAAAVFGLGDREVFALFVAIQRGFLRCSEPTDLLLRTYLLMCTAEFRTCVIALPRPGSMWKLVACVPDLTWLPRTIERLTEAGAFVRGVRPECGLVHALVPEDRVEVVANAVGRTRQSRLSSEIEFCGSGGLNVV